MNIWVILAAGVGGMALGALLIYALFVWSYIKKGL